MSLRDHLLQIKKSTGFHDPELDPPEIPRGGEHLWAWFWELDAGRTAGFGGLEPLSYPDILAWSQLTGVRLLPIETAILKALDAERLRKQ